jgi:hypothetical protein
MITVPHGSKNSIDEKEALQYNESSNDLFLAVMNVENSFFIELTPGIFRNRVDTNRKK